MRSGYEIRLCLNQCLNHTVQKDSRGVLGTSFRFGPTSEILKVTAKGPVLSPEKRDFTVLLTKFAFIVTFEEFLVLYSEQSFYKCLIDGLVPLAGITEENSTVQRDILNYGNISRHVHHL